MEPERILDVLTQVFQRHAFAIVGLALIAGYFALRAFAPSIRNRAFSEMFGAEAADEWPELEDLLMPVIGRTWRKVNSQILINFILRDKPSKTTRDMLAAYALPIEPIVLGIEEPVPQGAEFTKEALELALLTCMNARASRPTLTKIDHSEMLVTMFKVPVLANAMNEAGLSKLKVTYYLSHRKPLPSEEGSHTLDPQAETAWIRIHDDPYSTVDLVNQILGEVFVLDGPASSQVVDEVQRIGRAELGPYAPHLAVELLRKAIALARAAEAPLMLSLTTEDPRLDPVETISQGESRASRNPYAPPKSTV